MSRDDYRYYQSANIVSESEPGAEELEGEHEHLPGDFGGRYPGSSLVPRLSDPDSMTMPILCPAPAFLTGAGDDPYAAYDPGMAGCTTEPTACRIPGILWMGTGTGGKTLPGPAPSSHSPGHGRGLETPWISRGYERDAEEYENEAEPETETTVSASAPDPATDSSVNGHTQPPMVASNGLRVRCSAIPTST